MDINSISNLINTTTFPIALVIILLFAGYTLFNKYIAPLVQSCIESNREFVISLEKLNNKIDAVDEHVGNVDDKVVSVDKKVDDINKKIEKIAEKLN